MPTPTFPTRGEVEVPVQLANDILQDLPAQSALLSLSTQTRLSSRTHRQRVLDSLPSAYWLGSTTDVEQKQLTSMDWTHYDYEVAEIAVIVPLPDSLVDDADFPIWGEIRPRVVSAFGKAIDEAGIYGINRPSVWTTSAIVPGALAAGNAVVHGSGVGSGPYREGKDIASNIAKMGALLAEQGHTLDGFAAGPGFEYRLLMERDANGAPIYGPPSTSAPATIFGQSLLTVKNGAWNNAKALAVGGQWNRSLVGIRQDLTFTIHSDGVLQNPDGSIALNLMQQDSKALRAVMRLAHVVVDQDFTQVAGHDHYPFALLQAADEADYSA